MQGVTIFGSRPRTKSAFKANAELAWIDSTSIFGNEYDGRLADAPHGIYYVVGPDPYNKRTWYAQIVVGPGGVRIK